MVTRVSIARPVMEWAISRTRESVDELKERENFKRIDDWLAGKAQPTLKQAEALASAALIPFGYLLLDEPVDTRPPCPDFRTIGSKEVLEISPELEETIYRNEQRLTWYAEYARLVGEPRPEGSGKYTIANSPVKAAEAMRNVIGWPDSRKHGSRDRVGQLANLLEDAGILVMRNSVLGNNTQRRLHVEEFRGFTLLSDGYALIFINSADFKSAQLFSLAHEYGHVLLGRPGITGQLNYDQDIERWCNKFAAEFLISVRDLRARWAHSKDLDAVTNWAYKTFGVGTDPTVWSLVEDGAISRQDGQAYINNSRGRYDPKRVGSGGPDFVTLTKSRLGKRFLDAAVEARLDGVLDEEEFARQIGVSKTSTVNSVVEMVCGA
uniref:ImmA/IrrE family metallo-endopeptidase n=1 Tax=Vaginimicrobium propionicum TaxID=1871034 RepID=UPI0009709207|nr:ImmA/IrrE family metallo-endopeptidase [Vaginimicrobium propionicum]